MGTNYFKGCTLPALTYGMEKNDAVKTVSYELSMTGIKADIDLAGEIISIDTPLVGKFNIYNILAAAAAAKALQIPKASIKSGDRKIYLMCRDVWSGSILLSVLLFLLITRINRMPSSRCCKIWRNLKKKELLQCLAAAETEDTGKRPLMG